MHLNFEIKKNTYCRSLLKWSEIESYSPPMVLSKISDRSIQGIATCNSQEKIKSAIPREQSYTTWLVKNSNTVFSILTLKISLSVSGKQASKCSPCSFLSQEFRYFPAFLVAILVKYTVLFVLGKCLMDSEQIILIFIEVRHSNFYVSWTFRRQVSFYNI